MRGILGRFVRDERGMETLEYAIVAGIIVVGTVVAIGPLGSWVIQKFTALLAALQG